jgi:hypothetical protein
MRGLDLADVMAREHHIENRNRFPAEELEKYRGQWVPGSLDDTRILAHADDLDALVAPCAMLEKIPSGGFRGAFRTLMQGWAGGQAWTWRGCGGRSRAGPLDRILGW